ncbi:MAG: hypothetical protein LBG43_01925 [Treponema sp.]|nr:hypothetical protein [Treponema sp.]
MGQGGSLRLLATRDKRDRSYQLRRPVFREVRPLRVREPERLRDDAIA